MNLSKIIIVMFFLFTFCAFSQEEEVLDADFVDIDTLITDATVIDTAEIIEMSLPVKKVSWYFSVSPRVGADKIQKDYSSFLKQRADSFFSLTRKYNDNEYRFVRQTWFQPANPTGVSFCLETGIAANFSKMISLEIGAGYAFNRMKSIYKIENSRDSMEVLKMTSRLLSNAFSLSANYKVGFDTSYFSIKGIDKAGFFAGAAFVFSRYSERDTVSSVISLFSENNSKNYDGFGGSVKAGLFAQKNIGKNSIFEYSIGYLFAAANGYSEFWNRKFYWENAKNKGEILSISNLFILSISLII